MSYCQYAHLINLMTVYACGRNVKKEATECLRTMNAIKAMIMPLARVITAKFKRTEKEKHMHCNNTRTDIARFKKSY